MGGLSSNVTMGPGVATVPSQINVPPGPDEPTFGEAFAEAQTKRLGTMDFAVRYSPRKGQDLYVCHANPRNLEDSLEPTMPEDELRGYLQHLDAAAVAFGHLHFPYRRRVGRMLIADVASAGIPRDGDLRPAWGMFTYTPRGWRVQIRRVRYPVRRATQALTDRKVPGAPLLIHKMVEARYRQHLALAEAARRHSGLPPLPALRLPPGSIAGAIPAPPAGAIGTSMGVTRLSPPPEAINADEGEPNSDEVDAPVASDG